MTWINKVYYGTITIATNATSGTDTLSASVNTGKSFALFDNFNTADTTLVVAEDLPRIDLQDSVTVRARTNTANTANTRVVPYMLIEGNSLLSSTEQFSITMTSGASGTATVSAVSTSRSCVIHNGQTSTSTSDNSWNYCQARLRLTSTVQVTATRNSGAVAQMTVNGVVAQWDSSIITSVQEISPTVAAGTTTQDTTVTAVTDGKAFLFWGGWEIALFANSDYRDPPYCHRTSTTNVRGTVGASRATNAVFTVSLVDFNCAVTRRQAGQVAIASGNSTVDTTLGASVNKEKSFISWLGQNGNASGSANGALFFASVALQDRNTVRQTRGTTSTTAITTSWELGEFNDMPVGSLTLTAPALALLTTLPVPVGSLTLTGVIPSPKQGLPIPSGSLVLSTGSPMYIYTYQVEVGELTLSGKSPIISPYHEIQPNTPFTGIELGA